MRVDDIAIGELTGEEHRENLIKVCVTLREAGLTVIWTKCQLFRDEIEYCGHVMSAEGIMPLQSNLEAVRDAPSPTNVSELKALLGMVNYYRSFLPNLSTVMEALHQLLRKGVQCKWTEERSKAFCTLKNLLCS